MLTVCMICKRYVAIIKEFTNIQCKILAVLRIVLKILFKHREQEDLHRLPLSECLPHPSKPILHIDWEFECAATL